MLTVIVSKDGPDGCGMAGRRKGPALGAVVQQESREGDRGVD